MTLRKFLILLLVLGGLAGASWWFTGTDGYQQWVAEREKENLPPAEQIGASIAAPAIEAVEERYGIDETENNQPVAIPAEKNLAVPFTSQAPHANWDQDHNEFCEEASSLMVGRFFQRREIKDANDAEAALQQIKQWQLDNLGYYYDTTAAETAQILEGLYDLKVEQIENPTADDIKRVLAEGKLVIAPFAGREIGNPNYTAPGPLYHMMVIRGYTADGKFITNDPGTRRGEEYVYDQQHLIDVMHDWVPNADRSIPANGNSTGQKVILVVSE